MKKWSKILALGLCVSLIGTAALAEDTAAATGSDTAQAQQMQPPAMPDGQQPPAMPDGQQPPAMPDGQQPPAMPDGQQPPAMPNGQQPPAMPNGQQPPAMPDSQQSPAMPDGQQSQAMPDGQQPPAMPDGQQPPALPDGQQPPAMPDGQQPPAKPDGQGGPGGMGGPGGSGAPTEYAAANTVTESSTGASYVSEQDSENAVLVSGETVTLNGATVTKTGSADGDSADFYGINAAVLAVNGSSLTLEGAEITSDGAHANGVFSCGTGTAVSVSDTTITTAGNCSGGLMTTGGAALNASNVIVSTSGNSSAAIRSDRGGGTVTVSGGTYDTAGVGSPAIYSTADITVSDAVLSASASEAVVIEGGNSVTLRNVEITGSNTKLNGQSTVNTNVLIYQSMSGDASEGASFFTMTGGSMTALTGAMFHVTNTATTITLENVDFTCAADSTVFLDASADSWGRSGANGGSVTLNLKNQDITGAILCDSVSSVSVSLDENSSWTLTGDSSVSAFTGDLANVNLNGYTLYINGEAVK